MSSVRMCDKCERIFSENEEGWQSATLNTVEYDEHGNQVAIPIRQDLCTDCAVKTPKRGTKANETEQRIAALEAENKRLDDLTEKINQVGGATAK